MRRASRRIRTAALITLAAFLMNALVPFFAVYNLPLAEAMAAEREASSLFGEKMLICTADGFKWVSWADLQDGKEKPKPHPQFQCAVCYVAAHGIKDTLLSKAIEPVAAPGAQLHDSRFYSRLETLKRHLFLRSLLGRAPPYSLIG